jgi:N-acetylglucosamine PTS system EIICBA or EIICB component
MGARHAQRRLGGQAKHRDRVADGAAYFAIYYFVFHFFILRFNLKTPARDATPGPAEPVAAPGRPGRASALIAALGGPGNLRTVDACTIRLRLELEDPAKVDAPRLKQLGARGLVHPGGNALQVVLGPEADQVAGEMCDAIALSRARSGPAAAELLASLGGAANVEAVEPRSSRLCVTIRSQAEIDRERLGALGLRGFAIASPTSIHLLTGSDAQPWAEQLRALLTGDDA